MNNYPSTKTERYLELRIFATMLMLLLFLAGCTDPMTDDAKIKVATLEHDNATYRLESERDQCRREYASLMEAYEANCQQLEVLVVQYQGIDGMYQLAKKEQQHLAEELAKSCGALANCEYEKQPAIDRGYDLDYKLKIEKEKYTDLMGRLNEVKNETNPATAVNMTMEKMWSAWVGVISE